MKAESRCAAKALTQPQIMERMYPLTAAHAWCSARVVAVRRR